MREPFPYESNVSLLRDFFVPYPLAADEWDNAVARWLDEREPCSLLEHLAGRLFSGEELLGILAGCTGMEVQRNPVYLEEDQLDATGAMLHAHGLKELKGTGGRRLVAGGATINPDLRSLLGASHREWQWVLVSPLRGCGHQVSVDESRSAAPSAYFLHDWLRDLIRSQWSDGATDIHFERAGEVLTVRSHQAAGMHTIGQWLDRRAGTVTRLLCGWAGLSGWDHQRFLDGRLSLPGTHGMPELRLSAVPTVNGESLVLRAPAPALSGRSLQELGFPEELTAEIMDTVLHDPGLTIFTGSTGSGKTTSLYGILNELKEFNLKILTIEDPVERVVPFAVQCALNGANGWSFDKAIYAFLRQDPDVIMVGEIREKLSAEAACRAALTGHCVITTMHARDEQSAAGRLRSWGIPAGILAESLRLVVHQRLTGDPGGDGNRPVFSFWNSRARAPL